MQRIVLSALAWTCQLVEGVLCLVCLLLAVPSITVAQDKGQVAVGSPGKEPPYLIEADHLQIDAKNKIVDATGNVNVSREGVCIEAQEIVVDLKREASTALGNVRLLKDGDILQCKDLEYHWTDQTGWISNGKLYIQETGYSIEGENLDKTGPDTYSLVQGSFTTCDCPPSSRRPWRIGAKKSEITLGGYASIEKATVYLFEIPVLYLPFGYLPVKLHRESGFLLPMLGHTGQSGYEVGIPFYWAMNASMDATLTFRGLTKRGFKPDLEFRYTPSKETTGEINLSGMYDQETDSPRFGMKADHQQSLSSSTYDKLDLHLVSDNDYIVDFPEEIGHPSDRFVESRGMVGAKNDNLHGTVQFSYFDLVSDTGGTHVPQRAPLLHLDLLRSPVLSRVFSFGFGSSFVNFVNGEGSERTRLDLFPRLFLSPPGIRDIGLEGQIGFRETSDWKDWEQEISQGFQHREMLEASAGTSLPVWRRFQWGSYRLFHIVRPGIQYQYVEPISGERLSSFDGVDDYWRRNFLTYSISNSLIGGRQDQDRGVAASTFVECTIRQSLDLQRLRDHTASDSFSDILTSLTISPRQYVSFLMDLGWDPHGRQIRSVHAEARVRDQKGRYHVDLGYVSIRSETVDTLTRVELLEDYDTSYLFPGVGKTIRGTIGAKVLECLKASLMTVYLIDEAGKVENRLDLEYLSKCRCWSVVFGIHQTIRPEDVGFSVRFQLEGLGSYF